MDFKKQYLDSSYEEVKNGYKFEKTNNSYVCLICQNSFSDGLVFKDGHDFCRAEEMVKRHIETEHSGVFHYLLNLDKKVTGVSDIQKGMLKSFYQGLNDVEVSKKHGNINQSTVRNHRFRLKEAKIQAKVFLALMDLLDEQKQNKIEDEFVNFHASATMKDDRYITTNSEKDKIIKTHFDEEGRLKVFPSKEKKKIIVLQAISEKFKKNKIYNEKEVNHIIKEIYDDIPLIRRYLIQYGFMDREKDCSKYWVKS